MIYDPCRRRGNRVVGVHARQVAVTVHEGSPRDYLRRHERDVDRAVRGNKAIRKEFCDALLKRTADPRNLKCAWDYLAAGDGHSPGSDGMRYDDLDLSETWDMIRTVSAALLDNTYQPAADRTYRIPKSSGKGTRTLLIPTVIDRMVQRAIVQMVQPYVDHLFMESSLGYRPGCSSLTALAMAETLAQQANAWVWITEDIRDAFNQVPQKRLLDIVRHILFDADIVRLIERIVCTRQGRGLRQGGPLSPLLLNMYLDHVLDKPWEKQHPDTPLLRVADDLLILNHSQEEAEHSYQSLMQLLTPAGMPLKGTSHETIHDVAKGHTATWLGYDLQKEEGSLKMHLTEKAWMSLGNRLAVDHMKPHSPIRAIDTIMGWISQMGPC
jgi:retron-type reverse transcriptase